jgi:hypothetical protein
MFKCSIGLHSFVHPIIGMSIMVRGLSDMKCDVYMIPMLLMIGHGQ